MQQVRVIEPVMPSRCSELLALRDFGIGVRFNEIGSAVGREAKVDTRVSIEPQCSVDAFRYSLNMGGYLRREVLGRPIYNSDALLITVIVFDLLGEGRHRDPAIVHQRLGQILAAGQDQATRVAPVYGICCVTSRQLGMCWSYNSSNNFRDDELFDRGRKMIGASPQVSAAVVRSQPVLHATVTEGYPERGRRCRRTDVSMSCKSSRTKFCKTRFTNSAMRDRLLAVARMTVVHARNRVVSNRLRRSHATSQPSKYKVVG